jgi:hypothetical protein
MKKLITLLLLFTITLFYSIPTQAYTLDGNDIPLVQKKNLFDKDTAILGSFISITGTIGSGPIDFYHPDFIPIEAGQSITLSAATSTLLRIAFYDINQTFIIRNQNTATTFTISAPINSKFFRVNGLISEINSFQVERGSTATSYAPYGFLTLNNIFLDGNILSNPNFNNGTTSWSGTPSSTLTASGGILRTTGTGANEFVQAFPDPQPTGALGNRVYIQTRYRVLNSLATSLYIRFDGVNNINITNPVINFWYNDSVLRTVSVALNSIFIRHQYVNSATANAKQAEIDYVYAYNLTLLGIDHLSKFQLDTLFYDWQQNNAYIEGYDDGYDEGFDDGVASDTSYALGYALGLSEGEDMETGSSLLILIVALIGFVMMIFGFTTKRGIFNLLSVGAFVVLGTLLVEFVGFVIIAIGLVLINIYYAFFGDL